MCRNISGRGMIGVVLKWTTAGESHGQALVAIIEGVIADVEVTSDEIASQLAVASVTAVVPG